MFDKPNLQQFIHDLRQNEHIAHWHTLPERKAHYAAMPTSLDRRLRDVFVKRGIDQLYTHQRSAYDNVFQGENIVTVTPTASGKTLCYNLPVLQTIAQEPDARALYLFPTKALAQDQKK